MAEPWGPEVERIFTFSTEHDRINDIDDRTLRDADFSEEQLRELFDDGFLSRANDNDVTPDERFDARSAYFEWMEYLGYDLAEFDWEAWRDYMGYND
jgi:hypothetical protein